MKIPIVYGNSLGAPRHMATHSVVSDIFHLQSRSIIDTGCPFTIITEPNLMRTRVPISRLDYTSSAWLGNMKLKLASLGICKLNFIDTENKLVSFEQEVYAGKAELPDGNQLINAFPNFIGLDFLRKHRLAVIPIDADGLPYLEQR